MELLIDAIINNDVSRVKRLLEKGININLCEDDAGITPLHFAVQNKDLDIVRLLVEAGADIYARNEEQLTALDVAAIFQDQEIIDFLSQFNER